MLLSHPSAAMCRPSGASIRPNPASPQAANLIAWWPMAAPHPTLLDAAQQRYPSVSLTGTSNWSVAPAPGGWAFRFDGSTYWNWGDQAAFDFGVSPFAISCWAWFTGAGVGFLVNKRLSGDVGYDLLYAGAGAGTLRVRIEMGGGAAETADATGLNDGNYHHVLCGYDGTNVWLIIDGGRISLSAAVAIGVGVSSTTPFQLGARNGTDAFWTGRMFDVRVYGRAPTLSMAQQMYQPAMRWQLYQVPSRRLWLDVGAAAGGGGGGFLLVKN